MLTTLRLVITAAVFAAALPAAARAQSGIQWSGNALQSIDRAKELGVPLLFWVTERTEYDDDDANDLVDAQKDAFRDPIVLALTERYFVPCRVGRNSRAMGEAQKLGLPTNFGLYIAIISPSGQLLAQIDPGQVASPEALADRMAAASRAYRDSVYTEKLKPVLTSPDSMKPQLRRAVRTAWRSRIYSADQDIVKLMGRTDVTKEERARLYPLLGAFATAPCVNALLDAAAAKDTAAAVALARAEPLALTTLVEALPAPEGEVTDRQLAAYRAAAAVAKLVGPKSDTFWTSAKPQDRRAELDRVRAAAQAALDSWQEREGRWR
jgi:hypothetical protein